MWEDGFVVLVLLCQFKECLVKAKFVFPRGISEAMVNLGSAW